MQHVEEEGAYRGKGGRRRGREGARTGGGVVGELVDVGRRSAAGVVVFEETPKGHSLFPRHMGGEARESGSAVSRVLLGRDAAPGVNQFSTAPSSFSAIFVG